jgi:branched-subunit amino acid aminotransferase/4-amino-4-deoxychorismate lyase
MHKVALFNGRFAEADEALIPAVSAAAMYGRGLFTTIAVYNGEPFLLEKHWRRLDDNADKLGVNLETSFDQIEMWLRDLIAKNKLSDGRARVTLFDSARSGPWVRSSKTRTDVVIITGEKVERPNTPRLTISAYIVNSRSPLAGIKSCNYLEHLMAYKDAKQRGFDEAIRLDERGEVTSAAMANIFWLCDDKLYTPSLETGCLAGTTREFILENLVVREVCIGLGELLAADAVFLSSAGVGIRPVASIDDKEFVLLDHPILHLLPPNAKTRMSAR